VRTSGGILQDGITKGNMQHVAPCDILQISLRDGATGPVCLEEGPCLPGVSCPAFGEQGRRKAEQLIWVSLPCQGQKGGLGFSWGPGGSCCKASNKMHIHARVFLCGHVCVHMPVPVCWCMCLPVHVQLLG
jgi:hypothetical protein